MPLTHFKCPDDQTIAIGDCLTKCRMGIRCVSKVTLLVIRDGERTWEGIPSITQLSNGTRQSFLQIVSDFAISPKSRAFALLGSAHHKLLEDSAKDELDAVVEKRVFHDSISGKSDILTKNDDGTYTLCDYKSYGSYAVARLMGIVMEGRPSGEVYKRSGKGYKAGDPKTKKVPVFSLAAKDDKKETMQLNGYKWLYENAMNIKISKLELQITVRDGGTMIAKSRGITQTIYYPINIPVIPDFVVADFNHKKRDDLLHYLKIQQLPPECTPEETWNGRKCTEYCDVVKSCPEGSARQANWLYHQKKRSGN